MRKGRAVKQFSRTLAGLQGHIALFALGQDDLLLDYGYPGIWSELEAIRGGLEDIDLYDSVKEAVSRSEAFVRQGKFDEAEMLVLEVNRKLMMASGAAEEMRHRYKSAND